MMLRIFVLTVLGLRSTTATSDQSDFRKELELCVNALNDSKSSGPSATEVKLQHIESVVEFFDYPQEKEETRKCLALLRKVETILSQSSSESEALSSKTGDIQAKIKDVTKHVISFPATFREEIQKCRHALNDGKSSGPSTKEVKLHCIKSVVGFKDFPQEKEERIKCLNLLHAIVELPALQVFEEDLDLRLAYRAIIRKGKDLLRLLYPFDIKIQDCLDPHWSESERLERIDSMLSFEDLPQDEEEILECLFLLGEVANLLLARMTYLDSVCKLVGVVEKIEKVFESLPLAKRQNYIRNTYAPLVAYLTGWFQEKKVNPKIETRKDYHELAARDWHLRAAEVSLRAVAKRLPELESKQ